MKFRHASLFSGIGGPDLAAEWMGWKNVFHCEINPFGRTILEYYWPNSISYEDIKKTDFTIHRGSIDILTGGFPCQPYSSAGLRRGKEDERHLWPEMLRAIREIEPTWVVGENVNGIVSWNDGLVFEEVQTDLETAGYEVQPIILPAAGVDAPHRRDRVWFLARRVISHTKHNGSHGTEVGGNDIQPSIPTRKNEVGQSAGTTSVQSSTSSNTGGDGHQSRGPGQDRPTQSEGQIFGNQWERFRNDFGRTRKPEHSSDSLIKRHKRRIQYRQRSNGEAKGKQAGTGASRAYTKDYWRRFPTQSPVSSGNDGISTRLDPDTVFKGVKRSKKSNTFGRWRTESIKAAGNAIVPQLIFNIFKAIEQYELNSH